MKQFKTKKGNNTDILKKEKNNCRLLETNVH